MKPPFPGHKHGCNSASQPNEGRAKGYWAQDGFRMSFRNPLWSHVAPQREGVAIFAFVKDTMSVACMYDRKEFDASCAGCSKRSPPVGSTNADE